MGPKNAGGARVKLARPLERTIAHGHPWVYRDALERFDAPLGSVLTLLDRRGRFLARGLAEEGPIGMRVFTTRDEPLDDAWLDARLGSAFDLRARVIDDASDAYRLVHGEGDGVPGLVLDRYAAVGVMRVDGKAIEAWRDRIVALLRPRLDALGVETLLARRGRGEQKRVDVVWGEAPTGLVTVREHAMALPVDLLHGQKTGLFLDHRDSRRRVRELARGHDVLNLYAYTGGFSIAAGLGGAGAVTTVDVAPAAIELARRGWVQNGLDERTHEATAVDARSFLDDAAERRRTWSLIVADPPSFAPNEAARGKALRAYKAMHRGVLDVLAPGGLYLAASCSSHVDRAAFETTLREAAHGARRPLQILGRWGAGADHPVRMGFPEGDYLTVTLARALP